MVQALNALSKFEFIRLFRWLSGKGMKVDWQVFKRCNAVIRPGAASRSSLTTHYLLHHPTPNRPSTLNQIRSAHKQSLFQQKPFRPLRRNLSAFSDYEPTIYALSTAPGRAAIAIIRISGPACLTVYNALCPSRPLPKPRYAALRILYEPHAQPSENKILDAGALIFYFPAPETVTGEDVLELHVHGGPAIVKAVLAAIPRSASENDHVKEIRYAEPGEFTKRAFYNNRLDLTQVEALGDTLSAETEQQRRLAVRGSNSTLTDRYEAWRETLLNARGELEALIDFSEDQHFDESPATLCASVAEQVRGLQQQVRASISSAARGELLRNGINIALVGAPNAGKSSLLNRIVGREAAIVSEQAGTTRDVVDVTVDIGGYLCRFGDLAGLRGKHEQTGHDLGSIEGEGIRRARERALKADVVIVFLSILQTSNSNSARPDDIYFGAEVEAVLKQLDIESQKVICVLNKADLFPDPGAIDQVCTRFNQYPVLRPFLHSSGLPVIPLSCKTPQPSANSTGPFQNYGIEPFLNKLTSLFASMTTPIIPTSLYGAPVGSGSDSTWMDSLGVTERQRVLLQQCLQHLDDFLNEVYPKPPSTTTQPSNHTSIKTDYAGGGGEWGEGNEGGEELDVVLAAEHLRGAASCLARITGKGEMEGDVEDVLGVVFERFCVGK